MHDKIEEDWVVLSYFSVSAPKEPKEPKEKLPKLQPLKRPPKKPPKISNAILSQPAKSEKLD